MAITTNAAGEVTMSPTPQLQLRLYGRVEASIDAADNAVTFYPQVVTNQTYLGVGARHPLTPSVRVDAQVETQVQLAATPDATSALGSRNSYLGFESETWGALKVGKYDTPYKRATAEFDPFANTIGDMNAIVGNTGGDNRVEFDLRAPHAIWYESPPLFGLAFHVMYAPSQNLASSNDNFPQGESLCSGATIRSSGSGQPGVSTTPAGGSFGNHPDSGSPNNNLSAGSGFGECTDGSFGDLFSANVTYRRAGLVATASTEHHFAVNRVSDEAPPAPPLGAVSIHEEYAVKGGVGYDFGRLKMHALFEAMRRVGTVALYNERSRETYYLSGRWFFLEQTEIMGHYARATRTPGDPAVIPQGDNAADLYSLGVRHHFDKSAEVYLVGAFDHNHDTAHYGLGESGHGVPILSRDEFNQSFQIGLVGKDIKAVSVGAVFRY